MVTGWIGDAVSAGLDSLGLSQHGRDQYFNANLQREFLNKQQDFQREMQLQGQGFTKEMYNQQVQDMLKNYPELLRMASSSQFDLWKNQFNEQNNYNSPTAEVSRLLAAGINPNSVYGGQGSTSSNAMGASSLPTQAPQVSPISSPLSASPVGLPSGAWAPAQSMRDIASMARDFTEAKKAGVQTDQLEKLFDYEVAERTARVFGQRLANDAQSIANYINEKVKDTKVRLAAQELLKLIADTKNIDQDTAVKYEQVFTERSQQLLNKAKSKLSGEEYELLKLKVDNFQEEFKTTMQNIRSDTSKNKSITKLNNALTETENQLRSGKVKAQDLANEYQTIGNDLLYNDLWVSNRTLDAKIDGMIHQWRREGIITAQEEEKLYQYKVASKWAERQQFIQYVGATAQAIGNVLGGVGSAVSGAASWKGAQWNYVNFKERNRIQEEVGKERNRILDDYQKQRMSDRRKDVLGPDWELYRDQWHPE